MRLNRREDVDPGASRPFRSPTACCTSWVVCSPQWWPERLVVRPAVLGDPGAVRDHGTRARHALPQAVPTTGGTGPCAVQSPCSPPMGMVLVGVLGAKAELGVVGRSAILIGVAH
ncbi:hypothetical protein QJS66_15450 [Kocuria rhizophila]|nr:hypothetical protein QJS66_15450 [Kocuria rhizophila]